MSDDKDEAMRRAREAMAAHAAERESEPKPYTVVVQHGDASVIERDVTEAELSERILPVLIEGEGEDRLKELRVSLSLYGAIRGMARGSALDPVRQSLASQACHALYELVEHASEEDIEHAIAKPGGLEAARWLLDHVDRSEGQHAIGDDEPEDEKNAARCARKRDASDADEPDPSPVHQALLTRLDRVVATIVDNLGEQEAQAALGLTTDYEAFQYALNIARRRLQDEMSREYLGRGEVGLEAAKKLGKETRRRRAFRRYAQQGAELMPRVVGTQHEWTSAQAACWIDSYALAMLYAEEKSAKHG